MQTLQDLPTPALCADVADLEHNLATMRAALPGVRLRPHVKAHKCTALARRQVAAGHPGLTCATVREMEGLAAAGLGEDLLLANEVLDASRLGSLDARVTVAVDSEETIAAAAAGGVGEVLIDVNFGLPRCYGNPELPGARVWFCSDEHVTFAPERSVKVGDRVRVRPSHVDPTLAKHERLHLVDGEQVVDVWEIDLRGW